MVVKPYSLRCTRHSSPVMMTFLKESFTLNSDACSCWRFSSFFRSAGFQSGRSEYKDFQSAILSISLLSLRGGCSALQMLIFSSAGFLLRFTTQASPFGMPSGKSCGARKSCGAGHRLDGALPTGDGLRNSGQQLGIRTYGYLHDSFLSRIGYLVLRREQLHQPDSGQYWVPRQRDCRPKTLRQHGHSDIAEADSRVNADGGHRIYHRFRSGICL